MENNKKESGNSEENRKDMVEITIGDKNYKIHRGKQLGRRH
jgi:hypothetical protein